MQKKYFEVSLQYMSDEQKYKIQDLDEYIRQGEPQQRERSEAWKVAIGLQQVDRFQTSDYQNRIMYVDWGKVDGETTPQSANHEVKSAKIGEELPPKCNFCTLEEVAVLRIVQKNRYATQKEIAAEIGKSERTVKSITIALQDKQILKRVNGKRNGYWEVTE